MPRFCNSVCNGAKFRKTNFEVFEITTGMDLCNNVYAPLNTIAHKYKERDWSQIFPYLQGQKKNISEKSERLKGTKPTDLMLDFVVQVTVHRDKFL